MILRKMKILDFHKISYILVSIDTVIVGVAGFEPATSCSQSRRDDRATLHPDGVFKFSSGETGIRTLATVTRRQISNLLHYHSGTSPKERCVSLETRVQIYI